MKDGCNAHNKRKTEDEMQIEKKAKDKMRGGPSMEIKDHAINGKKWSTNMASYIWGVTAVLLYHYEHDELLYISVGEINVD